MKAREEATPTNGNVSGDATTDHQGAARGMSTRPREASGPFYIRTPIRILHDDRLSALEKLLFAVLILFGGPKGNAILHTGDLRMS